jgi:hypothetical protein
MKKEGRRKLEPMQEIISTTLNAKSANSTPSSQAPLYAFLDAAILKSKQNKFHAGEGVRPNLDATNLLSQIPVHRRTNLPPLGALAPKTNGKRRGDWRNFSPSPPTATP